MTVPKTVTVGAVTYEISVTREAINAASVASKCELDGHCNYEKQVIALEPELGPDVAKETLLHELIHASCRAAGVDNEAEETFCLALGGTLLDVLQRNPSVVKYLTT